METTLGDLDGNSRPEAQRPCWQLSLVHATDPAYVGAFVLLDDGAQVEFGRRAPLFGKDALDDGRLSRVHASLRSDRSGALEIKDLGSRNGTHVDGRKIGELTTPVRHGAIIRMGATIILARRVPARFDRALDDGLTGAGYTHAMLAASVRHLATRTTVALLCGDTGTGKDHLARIIHRESGRPGAFVVLDCGALDGRSAHVELFGSAEQPGALARAEGGTLYLDGIEEATRALQTGLLLALEGSPDEPLGVDAPRRNVRILAATRVPAGSLADTPGLRSDFLARLTRWVVTLPPIVQRPEDIPLFATAFAHRIAGEPRILHPRLVLALLASSWPGNLHELAGVIERAVIEHPSGPLRAPTDVTGLASPIAVEPARPRLHIAASGRWFELDGERHDLSRRRALHRLLAVLVDRYTHSPGTSVSCAEMMRAGWPDEVLLGDSGLNRVYVAMTKLRKLGLRPVIERDADGYRLSPGCDVVVTPS
ncbi:MAG TPA: FHA domain-containing protein [Nannocystis exedens]|nr:FHA domain-containing protein [Nannocystis exedens]